MEAPMSMATQPSDDLSSMVGDGRFPPSSPPLPRPRTPFVLPTSSQGSTNQSTATPSRRPRAIRRPRRSTHPVLCGNCGFRGGTNPAHPRRRTRSPVGSRASNSAKADSIKSYLKKKHISLLEFLHEILQREDSYKDRFLQRLYTQSTGEATLRILVNPTSENARTLLNCLNWGYDLYAEEMDTLTKAPYFHKWTAADLEDIELGNILPCNAVIESCAPRFLGLLKHMTRSTGSKSDKKALDVSGRYMAIISSMLYTKRSRTCTRWPYLWGIQMHSSGARRSLIDMMHTLGISIGYEQILEAFKSISKRQSVLIQRIAKTGCVTVSYDNFEQMIKVRDQRQDHQEEMFSGTTGLVYEIPTSVLSRSRYGLTQDMWNRNKKLELNDIIRHPASNINSEESKQISLFFVWDAIMTVFPISARSHVKAIDSNHFGSLVKSPSKERCPVYQTNAFTMGFLENESTDEGNQAIINDIWLRRFGFSEESAIFKTRLQLVYGDQKTVDRIRSLKLLAADQEDSVYHRYEWLMPVTALFHLQQAMLHMIQICHYGSEKPAAATSKTRTDRSKLSWVKECLGYKRVRPNNWDFHALETLVVNSFKARLVALFWIKARPHLVVSDADDEDILSKEEKALHELLDGKNRTLVFNILDEIRDDIYGAQADLCEDRELRNHILYLQQVETYMLLKYAIKHGDIGLISDCFVRATVLFHGSSKIKYAFETLYLIWLTSTNATSKQLKKVILTMSLVNQAGESGKFFPTDLNNEYLNGDVKRIVRDRRTSSIPMEYVFQYACKLATYCKSHFRRMRQLLNVHVNPHQSKASIKSDILSLARDYSREMVFQAGRVTSEEAVNLVKEGLFMLRNKVNAFNKKMVGESTKLDIEERLNIGVEEHPFDPMEDSDTGDEAEADVIEVMYQARIRGSDDDN